MRELTVIHIVSIFSYFLMLVSSSRLNCEFYVQFLIFETNFAQLQNRRFTCHRWN